MWIITKKHDANYKRLLLTNHEYTIGRAETDFIILDRSVSRLHANIFISYPEEGVDNAIILPIMKITDLSRFGTFMNTTRLSSNIPTIIPPNSEVTFGAQPGITFLLKFSHFNVLLSSIPSKIKTELRPLIRSLGGKILTEWTQECNFLVMQRLIVTHKVLCCLLCCIDIVTPDYLIALQNSHSVENFSYPDPSMYMPPIAEKGFSKADSLKFKANPNRCRVFAGKTFIFLSESKIQRFNLLLSLSTAKSVCVPEKLALSRKYFIDLFVSNSDPCLVYESGNVDSRHEMAYSVLKENFNRRPILDQEITLAIINSSCEVFCNALLPCPVVSNGGSLNAFSEYSSWNLESSNSAISRRASLFKRPREDSPDENIETDIFESAPKRQCKRTVILPPSTHSTNPTKKPAPQILVPDTERTNTQNNSLIIHNSPIKEELEKQSSPQPVFVPKALPMGENQNDNIEIDFEEGTHGGNPILDAFGSLPPFTSKLKEKKAASQAEKSTTKSVSQLFRKTSDKGYDTGENVNVDSDGDEVTGDDPVLGAFDSMPSFSSILKIKKKTIPLVEEPPSIDKGTPASETSIEENNTTLKPCVSDELPTTLAKIHKSPRLTTPNHEFSSNGKENIPSVKNDFTQPLPNPISTRGFLSKELGQKMAIPTRVCMASNSADEASATVPIKLCPLIKNTSSSFCLPKQPRILPDSLRVNVKRFVKVWPSFYKNVPNCNAVHQDDAKSFKSSTKINLVPYVPQSVENLHAEKRNNEDDPTQLRNEDNTLIDRLFDEITALPRVRLRNHLP